MTSWLQQPEKQYLLYLVLTNPFPAGWGTLAAAAAALIVQDSALRQAHSDTSLDLIYILVAMGKRDHRRHITGG